jgi:hypothetical protein
MTQEGTMVKYLLAASGAVILAASPAFAVGPNCGDQLAQLKTQLSSELLAQSAEADKLKEADRLCAAGKEMEAQQLAQELREHMAQKGMAGSSAAPTGDGTASSTARPSK